MSVVPAPAPSVIQRSLLPGDGGGARTPLYVKGGVVVSRTQLEIASGAVASFATYFGAFPASYWRAHTPLRRVRLVASVGGAARIDVKRTDSDGVVSLVRSETVVDGECAIDLDLEADIGWLWCEVEAGEEDVTIEDVRWETTAQVETSARITVAITTYDREADCVRLIRRIADDLDALPCVERIVIADQGMRRLRDADGFADVAERLGSKLEVVVQDNLGGSGGFSRGMIDGAAGTSSHVLVLDDDVDLETESLRRLVSFAEHATPTIVGAQMLSLLEPTVLHSFGERADRRAMWWGPVVPELSGADVALKTIENTPVLSRRIDVDFNGWWMCLIPASLIRDVGASLPFFIKWDDAEFGLRAAARGIPTVTLPGAALWHMPWTAKDDGLDWQAYFQLRNRILTALLHGDRRALTASLAQDANHVLCAQYGSVAVRNTALRDILLGPAHLDPVLAAGPSRPRDILERYGQSIVPKEVAGGSLRTHPTAPTGRIDALGRLLRVLRHQLRRASDADAGHVTRDEAKWWSIGLADRALVDAASGGGVFVVRRDRAVAITQLRRAIGLRLRLWWCWRRISASYRDVAFDLASPQAWRARFTRASEG